jgi:hypothetical protein
VTTVRAVSRLDGIDLSFFVVQIFSVAFLLYVVFQIFGTGEKSLDSARVLFGAHVIINL